MNTPQTVLDTYLAHETRLVEVFEKVQKLRHEGTREEQEQGLSSLMAEAYAKLVPSMEKLRSAHPDLCSRPIPVQKKSPKQALFSLSLDRIEKRVTQILEEQLPVRIVHNPDENFGSQWSVEDMAGPHYILTACASEDEAIAYAFDHRLPWCKGATSFILQIPPEIHALRGVGIEKVVLTKTYDPEQGDETLAEVVDACGVRFLAHEHPKAEVQAWNDRLEALADHLPELVRPDGTVHLEFSV